VKRQRPIIGIRVRVMTGAWGGWAARPVRMRPSSRGSVSGAATPGGVNPDLARKIPRYITRYNQESQRIESLVIRLKQSTSDRDPAWRLLGIGIRLPDLRANACSGQHWAIWPSAFCAGQSGVSWRARL
jgi:hypothetical protein